MHCHPDNRCPPVPSVLNALADSQLALSGTRVNYTCIDGYEFGKNQFDFMTICDGNDWTPTPSECKSTFFKLC